MDFSHFKIEEIYPRYKNLLVLNVVLFLTLISLTIFSFKINAQNGDQQKSRDIINFDNTDNTQNTDNIEGTDNNEFVLQMTILVSISDSPTPSLSPTLSSTNTIIPTIAFTSTPTNKPTIKPTIKPTSTLKPSPTKTSVPTPTRTTAPTPTSIETSTPLPTAVGNASCNQSYNVALLTAINNYRTQNGKPAYTLHGTVSIAACNHSYWMSTTGIFSHTGINGTTASQRCAIVGTSCTGENITMGNESYINPATIVTRWSGSAPHNANLLGAYTHIGIGRSGSYVTVDFAF